MKNYQDNLIQGIGNTPLIKLRAASEITGCNIYGKAEFMNASGSVKDRAALALIRDAEEKINKFPEVIKDLITELNEDIRHLLLFCSHNQYVPLEKLLDNPELNFNYKHRIDHVRITYKDPPNTKDRPKRIYYRITRTS